MSCVDTIEPRLTPARAVAPETAAAVLVARIEELGPEILELPEPVPSNRGLLSPYQALAAMLQGSFGHVGEIDALVALRERLTTAPVP